MYLCSSRIVFAALAAVVVAPIRAQWSPTALSSPRQDLAAVQLAGKALFAGGRAGQTTSAVVDVYDRETGIWSVATLSVPRAAIAATTVGPYALFAGGADSRTTETAVVDVYDASLGAPSNPAAWSTATLSQARFQAAATTVGSKAFFAGGAFGGVSGPSTRPSARVDIYDASLGAPSNPAAWSRATLSQARAGIAATTVGHLALFAGGFTGTAGSATVDIYDEATGVWSTAALSQARMLGSTAAAVLGTRAFFGGGQVSPTMFSAAVDVYDASVGAPTNPAAWTALTLSTARGGVAVTSAGGSVLFGGGATAAGAVAPSIVVDVFDAGTGAWGPTEQLSLAREGLDAVTVGGRTLFAGGAVVGGIATTRVDVRDTAASETVRLGTPPNPNALRPGRTSGPILGAVWDPVIDHAAFAAGATVDALLIAALPANLSGPFGTILCNPLGAIALTGPAGAPIPLRIPMDSGLAGVTLSAQGVSFDLTSVALTNALDITLGTR